MLASFGLPHGAVTIVEQRGEMGSAFTYTVPPCPPSPPSGPPLGLYLNRANELAPEPPDPPTTRTTARSISISWPGAQPSRTVRQKLLDLLPLVERTAVGSQWTMPLRFDRRWRLRGVRRQVRMQLQWGASRTAVWTTVRAPGFGDPAPAGPGFAGPLDYHPAVHRRV